MMKKFQAWIADPRERRRAMIVSAACMMLIALLIGMQALAPESSPKTGGQARFSIPPRPVDKPPAQVTQHPARPTAPPVSPAVITPATPPKSAARHAPASGKGPGESPAKAKKPSYYIQVGAFRERQHARNIIRRLRKLGWTLSMHRKKNGLFAVWVGPLASRTSAQAAKKKLHSQHVQGFIIKPPAP